MTEYMKSEKIDLDLLKKYTENTCTEKERGLIDDWLNSDVFDNVPSDPLFEANKNQLRQEIWESLPFKSDIQRKRKRKYQLLIDLSKYAACAAILITIIIGFLQKGTLNDNFFDDPKLVSQTIQVCDQPTYIIAEHDSEITFVSSPGSPKNLHHKVNCEKGNTYLAIMVKYKSNHEIVVIDKRDLQNLPPYLEMQIANKTRS